MGYLDVSCVLDEILIGDKHDKDNLLISSSHLFLQMSSLNISAHSSIIFCAPASAMYFLACSSVASIAVISSISATPPSTRVSRSFQVQLPSSSSVHSGRPSPTLNR